MDQTSVECRTAPANRSCAQHFHPGGTAEPSPSDMRRTGRTKDLLDEIEGRRLDPIVVSPTETVKMAARSLI